MRVTIYFAKECNSLSFINTLKGVSKLLKFHFRRNIFTSSLLLFFVMTFQTMPLGMKIRRNIVHQRHLRFGSPLRAIPRYSLDVAHLKAGHAHPRERRISQRTHLKRADLRAPRQHLAKDRTSRDVSNSKGRPIFPFDSKALTADQWESWKISHWPHPNPGEFCLTFSYTCLYECILSLGNRKCRSISGENAETENFIPLPSFCFRNQILFPATYRVNFNVLNLLLLLGCTLI